MTAKQYLDMYLGTRYAEQGYGYECVGGVKHMVSKIHKRRLAGFGGSAINGWISGSPFNNSWQRVKNSPEAVPSQGDVIFFDKTRGNIWGHVGMVYQADKSTVTVIEQNGVGSKTGLKGDAIRLKTYNYLSPKCLGWFTLNK